MSEIRHIEFPEKDLPLRNDVSVLGQLLGEALVEQHGQELLDRVESVRRAAILMREGEDERGESLEQALAGLAISDVEHVIKAFSTYLRLANLAEKVHRIRRHRAYQREGAAAQRGSLAEVFAGLCQSGVNATEARAAIEALRIRPVFTAHPTEATRRSFLEKEYSIIHRLVERLNPDLTPEERQRAIDRIRDAINSAWQTSAVPSTKPSVADELDNVLFYLTDILYRVAPALYESLEHAFESAWGEPLGLDTSTVLRLGSWVGGDMDGNPNVTAETLAETLETQRHALIRRYLPEVERMARYLSQTRGQADFLPEVEERLAEYRAAFPGTDAQIPSRHREMPYRCLLRFISTRLRATLEKRPEGYSGPAPLLEDVRLIGDSLEANRGRHAGLFGMRRLQRKIETFGFHLATLDARQDALVHRRVLGEWLGRPDWLQLSPGERTQQLVALLSENELRPGKRAGDTGGSESLRVFQTIDQAQQRYGQSAIGLFIISMTQGADDVLTALALARLAGLGIAGSVALDVAPLLETVDDLQSGPAILEELLGLDLYRQHLERRGNRQVVMVGYSDSNKDGGIASSRWSLFEAQTRLVDIGRRHGVQVLFFHGRGGTVSRGGGNLVRGIEGAPPRSVNGFLRVTEQGEVINQKYGIRPIALRNLELMTGAVLRHQLGDTGQDPVAEDAELMAEIAAAARTAYRKMVFETPAFISFFRTATPIDVIERLAIGSRPAARRSGEGIENLRAIPWVFSWAQVRVGLPGVYGLGTALGQAIERHGLQPLRAMLARWAFFQCLLNDAEMVLAKSSLEIGQRYAQLADAADRPIFERIETEFRQATEHLLAIKESRELLADQRTLQRNIRLRNPYADPLHILQINLLERWREAGREDGPLLDALKSTVTGIALAIQNTG